MLLGELMTGYTPEPSFTGELMADDFVLAIKSTSCMAFIFLLNRDFHALT